MYSTQEKRTEERIRFSWPFWFSFHDNGEMHRGQIVDLSQHAASFTVSTHHCPQVGQHLQTRFSYPIDRDDLFHLHEYSHWSEVIRVDRSQPGRARVAVRLHTPLPDTHYELQESEAELAHA